MAARRERLARELRQTVPDLRPVERAGERDARLEPLLVRRGARRVVAAEAHAPDRDFVGIEILALFDPVHDCACRALVVAADRHLVLGFALPRAVDRERGNAAREERLLVGMQLFLRRIEAGRHDEYRRVLVALPPAPDALPAFFFPQE